MRQFSQVHYGRASLSELSRLPAYFVFPRAQLDGHAAEKHVRRAAAAAAADGKSTLLVLTDQPYAHALPSLRLLLGNDSAASLAGPLDSKTPSRADAQLVPTMDTAAGAAGSTPTGPHSDSRAHVVLADVLSGSRDPPVSQEFSAAAADLQRRPCCSDAFQTAIPADAASREVEVGSRTSCRDQDVPPSACACQAAAGPPKHQDATCLAPQSGQGVLPQASCQHSKSGAAQQPAEPAGAASRSTEAEQSGDQARDHYSDAVTTIAGLQWSLPLGVSMEDTALLWLGDPSAAALTQLQLTYSQALWASYDPASDTYVEVSSSA